MKLKRKKAPGCDDIPTSLIVDGANEIAGPLSKLINRCLEMAIFPSTENAPKSHQSTSQGKAQLWITIDQSRYSLLFQKSLSGLCTISSMTILKPIICSRRDSLVSETDHLLNTQLHLSKTSSEPIWTRAL